jgi:hypothetical protein
MGRSAAGAVVSGPTVYRVAVLDPRVAKPMKLPREYVTREAAQNAIRAMPVAQWSKHVVVAA